MDKTGTLTENKLRVHRITPLDMGIHLREIKKLIGTYADFSAEKNAKILALDGLPSISNAKVVNELPFSSRLKLSTLSLNLQGRVGHYVL